MLSAFANTAIILVVSIGGTVLIGSMTAYAIDRFRSASRSWWWRSSWSPRWSPA